MNVVEDPDRVVRRLRKLWRAHREIARHVRGELLGLLGLPARLREDPDEDLLVCAWLHYTLPRERQRVASPYEHALATAIRAAAQMERSPAQSEELIDRLHIALLECQASAAAAAARQPMAKGGEKTAQRRKDEAAPWRAKAREYKAMGWTNEQIANRLGKSSSAVSRALKVADASVRN